MPSEKDNQEILSQIAQLAAAINRHKAQKQSFAELSGRAALTGSGRGRGGNMSMTFNNTIASSNAVRRTPSPSPVLAAAGRGFRPPPATSSFSPKPHRNNIAVPYKNMTLKNDKKGMFDNREMTIDGVAFIVDPAGRKLTRKDTISGTKRKAFSVPVASTPKRLSIGGSDYVRTKGGNLVLAKLVKTAKKHAPHRPPYPRYDTPSPSRAKKNEHCTYFTRKGICRSGDRCLYVHDRSRVAVCKRWLQGKCDKGDCVLQHRSAPELVPSCAHFQRGHCTKANCPYPHVKINPNAPVCRSFARDGFCEKGIRCVERHVWECPEFAADGKCENRECSLPHLDKKRSEAPAASGTSGKGPRVDSPPAKRRKSDDTDSEDNVDFIALDRYWDDGNVGAGAESNQADDDDDDDDDEIVESEGSDNEYDDDDVDSDDLGDLEDVVDT